MSHQKRYSLVPSVLALAAAAAALSTQAAQFSGRVKDSATNAIVSISYDSGVSLYRCDADGSCQTYVNGGALTGAAGFTFNIPDNTSGTFRLRGFVPFDDNGDMFVRYYQAESPAFVIQPGEGNIVRDLLITPLHPVFDEVQPCAVAQPGSDCSFSYTVHNPTPAPVSLSVWAEVTLTLPTPHHYTLGLNEQSRAPISVDLPAHGSRRVTQRFTVPADLPLGSVGSISLQGADGHSQKAVASAPLRQFSFVVGASPGQSHASVARLTSAQRIGPPKPISGRLVDAESGAPVTGSALSYVKLMQCDDASFAVCSHFLSSISSPWVGADGSYSINATDMPPGRYQVQVETANRTGYSAVVNYTGKAVKGVTVPVTHWLAHLSNITTCPTTLKVGSACTVSADVENLSGQTASFDIVANVSSSQSASPYPSSRFDVGVGADSTPVSVTLAAGARQRISIPLEVVRSLPIDGTVSISLTASAHEQGLSAASPHVEAGRFKIVP